MSAAAPSTSLVVCTYRRPALLCRLLESVVAQRGLPEDFEVLVVDNASGDDTAARVEAFADRLAVRCLHEARQGKSHALNTGLRAADGDLLLLTDDDVRLDPTWVAAFVSAARAAPDAWWFGGRVVPDWPDGAPPRWLADAGLGPLAGYFGQYDLGDEPRPYRADDPLPVGASMAVRRTLVEAIGGFRTDLGPRGEALGGTGDDTEFVGRAAAAGRGGRYVPAARCLHHVGRERLGFRSVWRYGLGKGANRHRMGLPGDASLTRVVEQAARGLVQALGGRTDRARICALNAGMALGHRRARRETR